MRDIFHSAQAKTLHMTRWFGVSVRLMPDDDGAQWWVFTFWYPRGAKQLGYLYGSLLHRPA